MVKNLDKFDVNSISDKSPIGHIGYISEDDLEYPDDFMYHTVIIHQLQKNSQFFMT